jgi:hypothetical protein
MEMDVKYVQKAPKGKTCKECSMFVDKGGGMGKCLEFDVLADGGCNMFKTKEK